MLKKKTPQKIDPLIIVIDCPREQAAAKGMYIKLEL